MKAPKLQDILDRLRHKYRLVVMTEDTIEEQFSFRLSQLNIYVFFSTLLVLMTIVTIMLIVLTPLKEYIPGYDDSGTRRQVYKLSEKSDSLERVVKQQSTFIKSIKAVLEEKSLSDANTGSNGTSTSNAELSSDSVDIDEISEEEAELRRTMEQSGQFKVVGDEQLNSQQSRNYTLTTLLAPVKGVVSAKYDAAKEHYAIDIVTAEKEPVKVTANGVVVLAEWTIDAGYVIAVQHADNLVSFYKHNAVLLKKTGNFVKAGDAIAIVGNTGEQTTGPHLHFELWHNLMPVNPTDFLDFN